MIIRIVRMTFQEEKVERFLDNFRAAKDHIRAFEGCNHVELLRDIDHRQVFFTYSYWKSPEHLEAYRRSDLFRSTWGKTKPLFAAPPEAWSVESLEQGEA